MTGPWPVSVSTDGAIHLGSEVVVDGFRASAPIRVQSHVHDDHLRSFNRSKSRQEILCTSATRDLLIARFDKDLPYRSNLRSLDYSHKVMGVRLFPSGHMLGSAQIAVETPAGETVGYSGDFAWPIETAMQVDYLVVDGTYGNPESIRGYTQGDAEESLVVAIDAAVAEGRRVYVKAHPGTLQRCLDALHGRCAAPVVLGDRSSAEVAVYQAHGYVFGEFSRSAGVSEDREVVPDGPYVRLMGPGEGGRSVVPPDAVFIVTSGFMGRGDSPITEYPNGNCLVAMSDHADFEGTLAYVAATGARKVLVDNSRGGNAQLLASRLRVELSVEASAETVEPEPWR